MTSMTYCRHENTVVELSQVNDLWDDFDPEEANEYELRARKRLSKLILEMQDLAEEYLEGLED